MAPSQRVMDRGSLGHVLNMAGVQDGAVEFVPRVAFAEFSAGSLSMLPQEP